MGYRSEVRCVIYGEPDKLQALITKHILEGSKVFEQFKDSLKRGEMHWAKGTIEVLELYGDSWKWYPDYPDVMAFTALRDEAPDFGLSYEFIRVGEEDDDLEIERGGDDVLFIIDVTRDTHSNFCPEAELDPVSGLLAEANNEG